jgi:hypothetical protein
MGVLPQTLKIIFEMANEALEIIFEGQMKRSSEKITRKISFSTYKLHFFLFSSFWTPPTFKTF